MWAQTMLLLLALSLAGGIICGVLWDVLKIQRLAFGISDFAYENGKNKKRTHFAFLFFHDLFFCIVFGCVLSVVLYYGNDGRFRILALIGMIAGFWAYRCTLGALVIMLAEKLFSFLRRVFGGAFAKLTSVIKTTAKELKAKIKLKLPKRAVKKDKEAV